MTPLDNTRRNIRRPQGFALGGLALLALPALGFHGRAQQPPTDRSPSPANGRITLFSGKSEDLSERWIKSDSSGPAKWEIKEGAIVSRGGDIMTKEKFSDFQLHIEFKVPLMPNARGQGRGNSGVFMQGRYEIQVLDSYGIAAPGRGDCGAVYGQAAPLLNACKPPQEWQTYDITFRAPRFDEMGKMIEKGRITVLQNGIAVQNNQEIANPTWRRNFGELRDPGPIVLQDHGNPVEYRNIWIQPLPLQGAQRY
jgi:hypothetical protein